MVYSGTPPMDTRSGQDLRSALTEVGDRLIAILPAILLMLALVTVGLVVAAVARALVRRIARAIGFDRAMERWGVAGSLRRGGVLRSPSDVLGMVCFWTIFVVATALPHLGIGKEMVLVAFGITFGGLVFALALAFGLGGRSIARELLERRLHREAPPERERLTHL